MTESFGDISYAARFRDLIGRIAHSKAREVHPPPINGEVISFDRRQLTCMVLFPGSSEPVQVGMGAVQPQRVGQKVRVAPLGGDLFLEDVIGPGFFVGASSVAGSSGSAQPSQGRDHWMEFQLVPPNDLVVPLGVAREFFVPVPISGLWIRNIHAVVSTPSSLGSVAVTVDRLRGDSSPPLSLTWVEVAVDQRTSGTPSQDPDLSTPPLNFGDIVRFSIGAPGENALGLNVTMAFG